MKNIIISILLIFGQVILAQKFNGFFIEPVFNMKTTFIYNTDYNTPVENIYFKLKPYKNITPIGGGAGFNIGYKFKNNNLIQLGVFRDASTSGFVFIGNEVKNYPNKITNIGDIKYTNYDGVLINNFNFLYKNEIFKINYRKAMSENFISCYLILGFSFMQKPLNGIENLTGQNSFSFYSYDSTKVTLYDDTKVFPLPRMRSFKSNTGIEITFGKHKKELFNISIFYGANFNHLNYFSFNLVNVSTTDKNQNTTNYNLQVYARANGFYYQISKRFYPFEWHANRQQKKLNEFKNKNANNP